MTTKEMTELAKEWKLDNEAALLAFSDYLLERDEVRWAQLIRWMNAAFAMDQYKAWSWHLRRDFNNWLERIKSEPILDYTKSPDYCDWKSWAIGFKLEFLDANTATASQEN